MLTMHVRYDRGDFLLLLLSTDVGSNTYANATAEAHSGKMILDKRRHHSTSDICTLITATTYASPITVLRATCIATPATRFACTHELTLTGGQVDEGIDGSLVNTSGQAAGAGGHWLDKGFPSCGGVNMFCRRRRVIEHVAMRGWE